jgi:hypothetical protein
MPNFMNEFDREFAVQRFIRANKPNRLAAALVITHLADWADDHSDGWAYWAKPRTAAKGLIALVESRTWQENDEQERVDATDEELAAAIRPVKAFLTRMAKQHDRRFDRPLVTPEEREYILRAAEQVSA